MTPVSISTFLNMDGYSKSESGANAAFPRSEGAHRGESDAATATTATAFVTARRRWRALSAYPGERPADLRAAYRVQDTALAIDKRRVAGWKVGRIPPDRVDALGADRLCGPIFAETLHRTAGGETVDMPVFTGGFAAAEAEFLLHLAPGWQGQVPEDDAAVMALVDAVHIGIEIASSPWAGINADGPCVTVSDFGNNAGLVIGVPVPDWATLDFSSVQVSLAIDEQEVGRATTATMLDGPLGAVRFLLANLAGRGIGTGDTGGLWISTGAVTGVHEVGAGAKVQACFEGIGTASCRIVPGEEPPD